jgi:hypothetical protein
MKKTLMALLVTGVAVPLWAHAEARYDDPRYDNYGASDYGSAGPSLGVSGDVGLMHYGRNVSNEVNNGVGYGAIISLSPFRNVELEGVYQGAVNTISDRFSTDGRVITNAVGGDIRFNIVPLKYDLPGHFEPYVFGGALYDHISTSNFTPGIADGINAFAVPVGLGLEADLGSHFLVGGRFTYNFLFNEMNGFGGRKADSWVAAINLGARIM